MVGVSSGGRLWPLGTLFDRGTIGGKTDAELLELFARGDAAEMAFEALVARHGPDVLRACRRVLPDPNDADDAFQATFLVLARRASSGSIGRPDSIGPWLYGAALRVARKARVAAARRRRHEQRVAARLEADSASRNDLADALRDEVERLPEPLRTPVVLCYLEDMSYQGAARRLDVSVGTIRGRLVKARGLLRSRLGRTEEIAATGRADGPASRGRPPRVPPALAAATIRAARTFAPGGAGMSGLSAAVAELMEGVLTMTIVTRWIIGAVTVAALCLAAAGGATMAARGDDDRSPATSAAAPEETSPKDGPRAGDPPANPHPADVLTLDAAIDLLLKEMARVADRLEVPPTRAEALTAAFRPVGRPQFDINISHPVDFSDVRRARSSTAAKTVAEAQFQDTVRNAIAELCSAYVDVQEAQERVRTSSANAEQWARLVNETQERWVRLVNETQEREKRRIDVDLFMSALIGARQTLFNDKITMRHRRDILGSMLGLPPDDSRLKKEVESLRFHQLEISGSSLIDTALRSRPDLAAYHLGVRSSEDAFNTASNRAAQTGDVYQLYQPYTFGANEATDREAVASWALGVAIPLPVYSRDRGNIERARINLKQTRRQLAAQEEAIIQEVGERRKECDRTQAEYRRISIALQRQKRASQEAERRDRTGEGGNVDVVNARHDLEKGERDYVEFLARHRRNVLALNTAVGIRLFP
jgi:RNA polymerase sigma factor (sigma-70 family)